MSIIECVPNFSEGRRPEVIQALVTAIQAPGVLLLDHSSDMAHNRSVITVAGAPEAVLEGVFRAAAVAARTIDLFAHRGEHPRIGATDVIPIVPVTGITLAECVILAHRLGKRIGEELGLPVYLYAAAATRPERLRLPDIRRGEFEGLVANMQQPERTPDYGPAQVGPAGAVVVGARPFLVAYNIYLATPQIEIARTIAKQIRESSGGLPAVQAKGFLVEGQAQVSINLLDASVTPLHVVFETVARLASQQHIAIDRSELIGLMPERVMLAAAAHFLKLEGFQSTNTIEGAMRQAAAQQA
ncbi:MAG: glutamate formimidoyltransferase [Caldilineaceae bacterium]|jgi:glutamate formiminotransferase|nr:glutamate formimidoyltransferase [Caldilineaceae bacterium]